MHAFWWFLNGAGDVAVVLPCAGVTVAWLFAARASRPALLWASSVALTGLIVAVSKLMFGGQACCPTGMAFTGASGHTALATVTSAGIFFFSAPKGRCAQTSAWIAGAVIGLVMGLSRVAIHVHTVPEVVAGFVLGMLATTVLILWAAPNPEPRKLARPPPRAWLWALLAITFWTTYGHTFPSELMLERIRTKLSYVSKLSPDGV